MNKKHQALKVAAWVSAISVIPMVLAGACSWFTKSAGRASDAVQARRARELAPVAASVPTRVPPGFLRCRDNGDCGGSWYAAICDPHLVQDYYLLSECSGRRRVEQFIRKVPVASDIPLGHILCYQDSALSQFWAAECPIDESSDHTIISRWASDVYGDVYPEYGNGLVDSDDLIYMVSAVGLGVPDPMADIWPCVQSEMDGDIVDVDDLVAVIKAFEGTPQCP